MHNIRGCLAEPTVNTVSAGDAIAITALLAHMHSVEDAFDIESPYRVFRLFLSILVVKMSCNILELPHTTAFSVTSLTTVVEGERLVLVILMRVRSLWMI